MATEWYYSQNEEQCGPILSQELKRLASTGKLNRENLVWKEGMASWVPASKVKGLFQSNINPISERPPVAVPAAALTVAPSTPKARSVAEIKIKGLANKVMRFGEWCKSKDDGEIVLTTQVTYLGGTGVPDILDTSDLALTAYTEDNVTLDACYCDMPPLKAQETGEISIAVWEIKAWRKRLAYIVIELSLNKDISEQQCVDEGITNKETSPSQQPSQRKGFWGSLFSLIAHYKCPNCGNRSGQQTQRTHVGTKQIVKTHHPIGGGESQGQKVYNCYIYQIDIRCQDCLHQWNEFTHQDSIFPA